MIDTRAVAAARLYARDYELLDMVWIKCRRCGRRVEPSLSQIHLNTAACRHHRANKRVKELGLIEVPRFFLKELDECGLCIWLETAMDEETGKVTFQAWVKPGILRYVRKLNNRHPRSPQEIDRRENNVWRLSMMTPRELEKELNHV